MKQYNNNNNIKYLHGRNLCQILLVTQGYRLPAKGPFHITLKQNNIQNRYNKDIDKNDGQTQTLAMLAHLVMSLVILEKSIHYRNRFLPKLKLYISLFRSKF